MKGKDLIARIQQYGLEEYDFPICGEDGMFTGYISIEDASRLYKVPISKIRVLVRNKKLKVVNVLNKELILQEEAETYLKDVKAEKSNTEKWKERKQHEFLRQRSN